MSAQVPDEIRLHDADDHVEVAGLSLGELQVAISLYRSAGEQRVRARANLSALVNRAMLDAHVPLVSAATQRQVQRSAALQEELLEAHGYETYASLAEKRHTQESSVRTWVSRMRERESLFTIKLRGQVMIPAAQLTHDGQLNEDVQDLVQPLLSAGLDSWSLWAWLCNPTGLLSGRTPVEVANTDRQRARRAAERFAAEVRQATSDIA